MNEKTNLQILKELLFGDIPAIPKVHRRLDDLCVWKQSQLTNGTTFQVKNPELLKCYTCTGHKQYAILIKCDTYQSLPPTQTPQKQQPISYRRISQSPYRYTWERGLL